LEDLRCQGKIRAIGVSNFSPTQMRMFSADAQPDAVQPPYNLFERAIERMCCHTLSALDWRS
jgi:aryl-alcohol dehydrogenase-like predicted oxidoreductase